MSTRLQAMRDDLRARMEGTGFDPDKDAELFEWADHWLYSNQLMTVSGDDLFQMFMDSYGVSLYTTHGIVPEDDD